MNPRPRLRSRIGTGIAVAAVLIFTLFPVYWMVNTSFLPGSAVKSDTVHLWPDEFTLRNFTAAWNDGFVPALKVSVSVTLITLVVALLFAFLAALALSRFQFRSRKSLIVLILVIQMIPAEAMISAPTATAATAPSTSAPKDQPPAAWAMGWPTVAGISPSSAMRSKPIASMAQWPKFSPAPKPTCDM